MQPNLQRALKAFDAHAFVRKHGGYKETPSIYTYEYLLPCPRTGCGSDRLRWNNQKHTFICWGCKLTGDTIKLIQMMERCDELGAIGFVIDGYVGGDSKIDSLDTLIGRAAPSPAGRARKLRPMAWPRGIEPLLSPCEAQRHAWGYLAKRGVSVATVGLWRLHLGVKGRLEDFIIFPVFMDGDLVYYQGRAILDPPSSFTPEERKAWIKSTGYRKTLNPITEEGYATAGEVLLGYDTAKVFSHVVIVEGPFDAMAVGPHAVALLGKAFSQAKLDRLFRMSAQRYTIYLDRGKEESESAQKIAQALSAFAEVFIATPPEGFDAGALSPEYNASVIANAVRYQPGRLASDLKP